eukprot:TRINITY_DN4163_c0_g1_i1.p1 TRINITY_DN4163_c0_g1~~TRINITY_DN4163_c0_g1_i1.p1  ORF type:complete len:266 (-),score=50.99 TRINITY_DN4163_c0_g1_i1:50-847(-)
MDAYSELVNSFNGRIKELRGLMLMRTEDSFEECQETLEELDKKLQEIEITVSALKEYTQREKQMIPHVAEIHKLILQQQEDFQYIQSNLPPKLPGRFHEIETESRPTTTETTISPPAMPSKPIISQTPQPPLTQPKKSSNSNIPNISYITLDELESTPKYIKGRLTQDKVNAGIDEFQQVVLAKYKLLSTPPGKLSEKQSQKYKYYKEMESKDTKGLYFITDLDLSECASLKQDSTGKSIIAVLRHLHRIKDLGGSTRKYAIISV